MKKSYILSLLLMFSSPKSLASADHLDAFSIDYSLPHLCGPQVKYGITNFNGGTSEQSKKEIRQGFQDTSYQNGRERRYLKV